MAKHTSADCDERCGSCALCYLERGLDNECDRLCQHAAQNHPPEDEDDFCPRCRQTIEGDIYMHLITCEG